MNELMQANNFLHTENSTNTPIQYEIPSQVFDHSVPVIRNTVTVTVPAANPQNHRFLIQIDGGANRSITNNADILINFRNIKRYAMAGISDNNPAIYCTGKGLLPWIADTGEILYVSCYYSHQAAETLISPTDVVLNHIGVYRAWSQHADIDTGQGSIQFYHRNGYSHAKYTLHMQNGLWYYENVAENRHQQNPDNRQGAVIHRVTTVLQYYLLHERLAHPGQRCMSIVHLHFADLPKVSTRNIEIYPCGSCALEINRRNHAETRQTIPSQPKLQPNWHPTPVFKPYDDDQTELTHTVTNADALPEFLKTRLERLPIADCRYQMDFGFPRGSLFKGTDVNTGSTYTSIDGYRAYLIIILYPQRRVWVFLVKNKKPPIEILRQFLRRYDIQGNTLRVIRTDQGGELWNSHAFKQLCCDEFHYVLQPTAPGAPSQNGLVERPNRTFGKMMRCMLHAAGLGPQFWSYALLHAVYIYNRLPHSSTGVSPYTAYTGTLPTAKYLRIFGCRVIVRRIGERAAKLDHHTNAGTFLGYTATDKNIIYMDEQTREIKTSTYVVFDEAHLTAHRIRAPPSAVFLQRLGFDTSVQNQHDANDILLQDPSAEAQHATTTTAATAQFVLLTTNAKLPTRGSPLSVGYDLYSAQEITINPNSRVKVLTDIAFTPPPGHYGQILSRSGLAANKNIDCHAGVIDPDYTGNLTVLLNNSGPQPHDIQIGDKIAQLVFIKVATPQLAIVDELQHTERAAQGFGSTDTAKPIASETSPNLVRHLTATGSTHDNQGDPHHIDPQEPDEEPIAIPYDIILSPEPYDHYLNITIDTWGSHPTLGMLLDHDGHRLILKGMAHSTPGHRVPRHKSTLLNATPIRVANSHPSLDRYLTTAADLEDAIKQHRENNIKTMTITFGLINPVSLHPQTGNPQIHQDQLNAVQKVLFQIKHQRQNESAITPPPTIHSATAQPSEASAATANDPELSQTFTLKQLKQRPDWPEWRKSQFKQLQQYADQNMFGVPQPLPKGANALYLLWTYVLKVNGIKKARCVCNGNRNRGAVTMGHIFANALSPNAERLFWAIVAKEGLTAIGADVSNAFAEAPPPQAPFYVYVDEPFRDWWENELNKPPIPKGYVLRVNHALQGHPESPRLWEKHIDGILKKLHFKPTTHDPCLYHANINNKRILFLRQVDDFSIAAKDPQDAHAIIAQINAELSIPVKDQGLVEWYNGVDVDQTKYYVRLHATTYFHKMLKNHGWFDMTTLATSSNTITPMHGDNDYIRRLEKAVPPEDASDQEQLCQEFGFRYRQVIGEVLYPMVKCRPDISTAVIKLSQYMANPAREHYQAVDNLIKYVAATYTEGIVYWREHPCNHLPDKGIPTVHPDNHTLLTTAPKRGDPLFAYSDSDWGADTNHRLSITGIIVMYAGAAIGYKTKYQDTIALSSTEAEFVAACDTAKLILYFRSLLHDLDIPQDEATVIYEDNRGALLMVEAQQPTKNSRHIDIKHYAILDWTERDMITLQGISTHDNASDSMTKPLARQLFYRHFDTYMGRRAPQYFIDKFPQLFQNTGK